MLLQKMIRASFDRILENGVFSKIPRQINGSGSQWKSKKNVSKIRDMRALFLRGSLTMKAKANVVGGGELVMVLRL